METEDAIDFDPAYIAGLLDGVGRVRFDISDGKEGTYTVRPMLRLQPNQTPLRTAVIGEFLEQRNYQYDFIDRNYGDQFFRLQQRSDIQDLQSFLEGQSAHLVRELAFVNGPFAEEFDFEILEPQALYRFTLARDALRYGWRPKGRFHTTPEDVRTRHDIDPDRVETPPIPPGNLRTDYTIEWIAGLCDGQCRYRPSINESSEHRIGYAMYPIARFHRSGVSSQLVSNFLRFCDEYSLSYGDSSEANTLRVVFTGPSNIRRTLDVLFPRLLVLSEASELLLDSILPRFDSEDHHDKQGFYDILCDFDHVAKASGGPFRHRDYDPAHFANRWHDDLELVREGAGTFSSESTPRVTAAELEAVSVSPEEYQEVLGRYQSILDRKRRDTAVVLSLKNLYDDRCQLCGVRLASADGTGYSEVHHLKPLGPPHKGADVPENMLVLCPTHHADFDNGVVRLEPTEHMIEHPYDSEVNMTSLSLETEHTLSEHAIQYHNQNICQLR